MSTDAPLSAPLQVVLVTGISGAGKSIALHALEDLGFEAIDNIPIRILPALFETSHSHRRPMAVGVDVRTRDFSADTFFQAVEQIRADDAFELTILFLDSDDEILVRRFSETRRLHPLAEDRRVSDGLAEERTLLEPIRRIADMEIDTSDSRPADLGRLLRSHFGQPGKVPFSLFILSFSYKKGLPREADLVFDVRFLRNPHYDPELRDKTGRDADVAAYVAEDPHYSAFLQRLQDLVLSTLGCYMEEGKRYLTIAIGCTGGQHRSVALAERLTVILRENGYEPILRHRELG